MTSFAQRTMRYVVREAHAIAHARNHSFLACVAPGAPILSQAGFIAPTAHEAVSDILAQAEKDRVEELLRQCLLAQRPHSRTQPVTPRLGPHPTEELSSAEAPSENDGDPVKSTSPRLGGYSNQVSDRPLCYMRAPSEKVR